MKAMLSYLYLTHCHFPELLTAFQAQGPRAVYSWVKWDKKVSRNNDSPTSPRTKINMHEQKGPGFLCARPQAHTHARTHICAAAPHTCTATFWSRAEIPRWGCFSEHAATHCNSKSVCLVVYRVYWSHSLQQPILYLWRKALPKSLGHKSSGRMNSPLLARCGCPTMCLSKGAKWS